MWKLFVLYLSAGLLALMIYIVLDAMWPLWKQRRANLESSVEVESSIPAVLSLKYFSPCFRSSTDLRQAAQPRTDDNHNSPQCRWR
jgi:hypothetical protein